MAMNAQTNNTLSILRVGLVLLALGMATTLWGQANPPAAASAPAADPVLSNPEYQRLYNDAAVALQKKDYAAALGKLDELDKAFPNAINAVNLRGAVYTEQRDFAKAGEAFAKAADLDKKAFPPRFNIGEVLFLQKKYAEARAKFEALQAEDSKNDLVRYKVFLCYLAAGEKEKAEKVLGEFNFAGDLPAYYFAHAAWEFAKPTPNLEEAKGWLESAGNIYSQQANLLFVDSLVELGYLKREEAKKP
jgi:Flp pilus assembly protein TadD